MSAADGVLVRGAHGVAIDWTIHLVRDLPAPIAEDRFAQIVSDLWEQEHAFHGPGALLAASVLLRVVRGVPSDLAWRRGVLADHPVATAAEHAWVPLHAEGKPFDQTNGSVELDSEVTRTDDGAELRDLLSKGMAANAAFGFFGGGSGI